MDDSRFHDWRDNQATPEEEELVERVLDFSELFEDMLFLQGTTPYSLIRCQSKLPTGDIWIDDAIDLPPELISENKSMANQEIQESEMPGTAGHLTFMT